MMVVGLRNWWATAAEIFWRLSRRRATWATTSCPAR